MPLVAALAAGNRIMLKPSELTPRTAQFLAEFLGALFPQEKVATVRAQVRDTTGSLRVLALHAQAQVGGTSDV